VTTPSEDPASGSASGPRREDESATDRQWAAAGTSDEPGARSEWTASRPSEEPVDSGQWASSPTATPNPPDTSTQPEPFDPYRFGPPGPNPYGYPEYPMAPPGAGQGENVPAPSYPPPGSPPPYGASATQPHFGAGPTQPPYGAGPTQPPYGAGAAQPPYQQYPTAYPPPAAHQYAAPRTGNGRAIAALVLGILSIVFAFLSILDIPLFVLGIIFGVLGLRAAKRGAGGRNMAVWGLTCAIIGGVLCLAFTGFVTKRIVDCGNKYDSGTVAYEDCVRTGH
jgi:hypothetical protein